MSNAFVEESAAVLSRTPATLDALLRGLQEPWTTATEGPGTWSPYTVIGHLIHGEQTDWIPRLEMILQHGVSRTFEPFDREGQFREDATRPLAELLDEFAKLRGENLARLRSWNLQASHLELQGRHPALGLVTLRQLIATWTTHDLSHIVQVGRVLAKRYKVEVGPWVEYLSVMK